MTRTYLRDITNDHKTEREKNVHSSNEVFNYKSHEEWKIQLTVMINFAYYKDPDEIRTMHKKINNIEIMMGNETDEIIEEHFEFLLQKYQEGLV